uniref:Insulin-like domain-containing protein n=1 Tax=Salarias fasciatus TaxID=181472 RepID=A0A672HHY5_SALFA
MRTSALLVTLLCTICAAQLQTRDNANPLRLCGRAFLRAVVYTCGGSRWRRQMGEEDTLTAGQQLDPLNMADVLRLSRHWRDQNQALMSACCQQGCRRSELSLLC